jgi:hypothetical protein
MPSESKNFTAALILAGKIDSSFTASAMKAAKTLEKLEKMTQKMSGGKSGFANMSSGMNEHFGRMESRAKTFAARMKEHLSNAFDFTVGNLLANGISNAFEGIKGAVEEGSKTAAEREVLKTQIGTLLNNKGQGNQTDSFVRALRYYSDKESVFHYAAVAQAGQQLLAAKYGTTDAVSKINELGELAPNDEKLGLVTSIDAAVHNRGYLTKGDLSRMQADAKVPIYSALLKAMGKDDNLKNESDLFKQLRNPQKSPVPAKFWDEAIKILAEGAFKGHQAEQLKTFEGQWTSLDDKIKDVSAGLGGLFNAFSMPVMNWLNEADPNKIQDYFDQFRYGATALGQAASQIGRSLTTGEAAEKLKALGSSIAGLANAVTGNAFAGFDKWFTKTTHPVFTEYGQQMEESWNLSPEGQTAVDKITSTITGWETGITTTLNAISSNWNTVKDGMIAAATVWGASKVAGLAGGIAPGLSTAEEVAAGASVANPLTLGLTAGLSATAWTAWKQQQNDSTGSALRRAAQFSPDFGGVAPHEGEGDDTSTSFPNLGLDQRYKRWQTQATNSTFTDLYQKGGPSMNDMHFATDHGADASASSAAQSLQKLVQPSDDASKALEGLQSPTSDAAKHITDLASAAAAAVAAFHQAAAAAASFHMPSAGEMIGQTMRTQMG